MLFGRRVHYYAPQPSGLRHRQGFSLVREWKWVLDCDATTELPHSTINYSNAIAIAANFQY